MGLSFIDGIIMLSVILGMSLFLVATVLDLGKARKSATPRSNERPGGRNQMKRIVRLGQTTIGVVGVLGTLAGKSAMVLAVVGIAGVGTEASMAGMSTGTQGQTESLQHPGLLAFLREFGPVILLVSIAAFALELSTRRWGAAVPALLWVASSTEGCTASRISP